MATLGEVADRFGNYHLERMQVTQLSFGRVT